MSKSARKHAPPRGVWGHAPPGKFLDCRSSEIGSSAI